MNLNLTNNCAVKQQFVQLNEFLKCYIYFIKSNKLPFVVELLLILSVLALNLAVIITILNQFKVKSIYEKIIIGHCISNFLSGLLIMPFFHINNIFSYWPFYSTTSIIWAVGDNTINTVTNLHMLYMSYVRLRSIKSPKLYSKEFLLRHPYSMMLFFWAITLPIWLQVAFYYKTCSFTTHINYHPHFVQSVINFFMWLLLLILVIGISLYIIYFLIVNKVKKKSIRNKSLFRMLFNPKSKFTIIIAAYILQWSIPSGQFTT